MRPRDAKTQKQHFSLPNDNHSTKGHWILLDPWTGAVTISAQIKGESRTAAITIPRGEFNRLIDWYMKDQHP